MKKILCAVAVIIFVVAGTVNLFSEAPGNAEGTNAPNMDKGMMGKEMMGKGMMGVCPMHGMMMKREIIASQDGGVIILMGNKLSKYDKDLNLVKEATIDVDIESMQKMMEDIKAKCPMCSNMMKPFDKGKKGEEGEINR